MSAPARTPRPSGPPRRRILAAEVVRTVRRSPHFQRVTLAGGQLADFEAGLPAGHVKLFLPAEGQLEPVLPVLGPDGLVQPEGTERPVVRTYTPRRFDPERGELDVDLVLHGTGPASTWAQRTAPGDRVGVAGPGRGYEVDERADWLLLAGDETALPAIGTIVESLPAGAHAVVHAELPDPDDAHPFAAPAGVRVDVTWLPRTGHAPGELMEAAVRTAALPAGRGHAWVAGEATVIRRLRSHLLDERGMDRARVVTRGYWKQGDSDHPDHDYGE